MHFDVRARVCCDAICCIAERDSNDPVIFLGAVNWNHRFDLVVVDGNLNAKI